MIAKGLRIRAPADVDSWDVWDAYTENSFPCPDCL